MHAYFAGVLRALRDTSVYVSCMACNEDLLLVYKYSYTSLIYSCHLTLSFLNLLQCVILPFTSDVWSMFHSYVPGQIFQKAL